MTAVRFSGEPCGAGVFLVASKSVQGDSYGLTVDVDGVVVCPCRGFTYRRCCRHAADVALAVEIENRQTAAPRRAAAAHLEEIERFFAR